MPSRSAPGRGDGPNASIVIVAVADTSPLDYLIRINCDHVLPALYERVYVDEKLGVCVTREENALSTVTHARLICHTVEMPAVGGLKHGSSSGDLHETKSDYRHHRRTGNLSRTDGPDATGRSWQRGQRSPFL